MFGLIKKKKVVIYNPLEGEVVDLSTVEDEVFASKMVGDGFAILPTTNVVLSPCKGFIKLIFPTKHAIGIQSEEGLEVLIHIGLDTVELKGEGFESLVTLNQKVDIGTPLIRFDQQFILSKGKQLITPIVFTNKAKVKSIKVNYGKSKIAAEVEIN